MVLILSENFDFCTSDVIKWLDYYNLPWFRINEDDEVSFNTLEYKNNQIVRFIIDVNGQLLDLSKVHSYWYRRGMLSNPKQGVRNEISPIDKINRQLSFHLMDEISNVMEFVHHYLEEEKISINSYLSSKNNKSYYQHIATLCGLEVPDTLVCINKSEIEKFQGTESGSRKIITKSINELFSITHENNVYHTKTYEVDRDALTNGQDNFLPTLFQVNVPKFCELRVFYLVEEMYAMAIFSQRNEKTQLDYRNYDYENPNRYVPFLLPESIKIRLLNFMKRICLNCGSIDMILTPDNKYVFLEVNPVGQFGMVSEPCNYYLEKKIALILKAEYHE